MSRTIDIGSRHDPHVADLVAAVPIGGQLMLLREILRSSLRQEALLEQLLVGAGGSILVAEEEPPPAKKPRTKRTRG